MIFYQATRHTAAQVLPLYGSRVAAGFPSPADDYLEGTLDLNHYLITDAAATFMIRVSGDSMSGAGISDGDILLVDRSLPPLHGHIVLAVVDGAFTIKRLHLRPAPIALIAENPAYMPIEMTGEQELQIWGVVTACVKKFV